MYLFPSPGAQDIIDLLLWLWVVLGLIYLGVVITPHLAGWQQSVQNKDKRRKWTFVQKVRKHPSWHLLHVLQHVDWKLLSWKWGNWNQMAQLQGRKSYKGTETLLHMTSSALTQFLFIFISFLNKIYILLFQFAYRNRLHNE